MLTAAAIIDSCAPKFKASATITAAAFSCICFDGTGKYVPTSYDDAASSCTSFIPSAYQTMGNAFLAYVAGFRTDPSYASATATAATTTAGGGSPVVTSTKVSLSCVVVRALGNFYEGGNDFDFGASCKSCWTDKFRYLPNNDSSYRWTFDSIRLGRWCWCCIEHKFQGGRSECGVY
jgi:hypothetical protein